MKPAANRPCEILVVDDELRAYQAIRRALKRDDCHVSGAITCEKALARLQHGHFDAMIVDRALLGIKGDQLAARVKRKWPDVQVIMTSAFALDFKIAGTYFKNVDYILDKSFERGELLNAIASVHIEKDPAPPVEGVLAF